MPAFGCPSIVEAFLAKRMKVQFYRVTSSLDIDVDDIQQRVIPGKTKALLFIQYFGFLQDKQKVDKLKELGLVLIEDRAHALFSKNCNISADYSFASLRKLLPVPEGCLLWSKLVLTDNTYKSFIKRHRNKLSDINLTVFRTLALIVAGFYQRHPKQLIKWLTGNIFFKSERLLNMSRVMTSVSGITKRIMAMCDLDICFSKRRENFRILAGMVEKMAEMNLIRETLLPEECPLGLPVRVKNRKLWQYALQQMDIEALPLWELHETVKKDEFSEAAGLAEEILVLPVNQNYSSQQMKHIARKICFLLEQASGETTA